MNDNSVVLFKQVDESNPRAWFDVTFSWMGYTVGRIVYTFTNGWYYIAMDYDTQYSPEELRAIADKLDELKGLGI